MLRLDPNVAAAHRLRLVMVLILCGLAVRGMIAVAYDDLPRLFPNFHGVLK